MLWVYTVLAAAATLLLDSFCGILRQNYSWWLTPVLLIGFLTLFLLIHAAVLFVSLIFVKTDKPPKAPRFYRALITASLNIAFKLARVHIHLSGDELLDPDGSYLFVINHTHLFDPAVMLCALPQANLAFVSKKEAYTYMPLIAKAMHTLWCIPLDRENNRNAVKSILTAVNLIKNGTANIGIFPEGRRTPDGRLQEFRPGAFKIATKSGADIAVCTLVGVDKIQKNMFRRRTDVYFDIVKILPYSETSAKNTHEISDTAHNIMSENLQKRQNTD